MSKKRLIIFASGSGSNAENVTRYLSAHDQAEVVAVFCNQPQAYVIERMKPFAVPVIVFDKQTFLDPTDFLALIDSFRPDMIALLGFLWKIPRFLIDQYPNRIINLHPALLPAHGGKGMYGMKVHEAVKRANETMTGITLHFVNENYDEGSIIAQFQTSLEPTDTVEVIASKIHALEQAHVPEVIAELLERIEPKKTIRS